jgi:hypothetical protein
MGMLRFWLRNGTALIGGQLVIERGAVRERGPSGGHDCQRNAGRLNQRAVGGPGLS